MRKARLLACALALLGALAVTSAAPAARGVAHDDVPYDATPLLDDRAAPEQRYEDGVLESENPDGAGDSVDPPVHDGEPADLSLTLFDFSSTASAGPHQVPFWLEYSGAHADVYVGWNDLAAPPGSGQQAQVITAAQVASLGAELDGTIWPSDVFHFGNYEPRCPAEEPGCDGDRLSVFVYNVRDDAYWTDFPFYIAGFFWADLNDEIGRNALFMDSFDWPNRTGPAAANPFLVEGTLAHELAHLIHNDVDGDEETFMDEGAADLASLFAYGTPSVSDHLAFFLFYHRDSLLDWEEELADYGNAALWWLYLFEQEGGGDVDAPVSGRVAPGHDPFADDAGKFADPGDRFVWDLFHDSGNGLAAVANQTAGEARDVEQLHRDFTLANLLDGRVSEPEWNYANLEIGGADTLGVTIDDGIAFYEGKGGKAEPPRKKKIRAEATLEPWSAEYRTFGESKELTYRFSGNPTDGIAAPSPPTQWWSGFGSEVDRSVGRVFEVVPGDTLRFATWFDIEEGFDAGLVEASADGVDWVTLAELTGSSGGAQVLEYPLTGFAGPTHVRFRYLTDASVNGQGWYVDDVQVGAVLDTVSSDAGWTNDGWELTTGLQANDWTADAFVPQERDGVSWYEVRPVVPTAGQGLQGSATFFARDLARIGYAIVANRPDGDFDGSAQLVIEKSKRPYEPKLGAKLAGSAEVPGPADPDGRGRAKIVLDEAFAQICWKLEDLKKIASVTEAHVHQAPAGSSGPVIVTLAAAPGCTPADRALIRAVGEQPEQYYVNVHTTEFPDGAIRGQLGKN